MSKKDYITVGQKLTLLWIVGGRKETACLDAMPFSTVPPGQW